MMEIYKNFICLLEKEDKEGSVNYILQLLQSGELDIINLYSNILTPALNAMECKLENKSICIWKEHVRTAIVRTIVECCYPYVIEKKKELGIKHEKTAVVLCPPEEYHDLGARMVADFFTICGYKTIYVGSSTPYQEFINAMDVISPDLVAISVSNYYNLFATKKMIHDIKLKNKKPLRIVVGGHAINQNPENYKLIGADDYAISFNDIKNIAEGGARYETGI